MSNLEITEDVKKRKQTKNIFNENEITALILYFITIFISFLSEKNSGYIISFIIFSMVCYYVLTILKTKSPTFDFVGFFGFGIIVVPILSLLSFILIDKFFQTKEFRIKENYKYGIEYIKEEYKNKPVFKIYINSSKEIKELEELEYYELKFMNCQTIKIITEYNDITSIFFKTDNLSDNDKQKTYLKDDILNEKIICVD